MLRATCVGLIGWCIACGPSVAVSDGDSTTSGTTTTTTTIEPSTTDNSATVADVTTVSPESSSTTDATTSDTTTAVDESSSSGEFTCGCPDPTPIGLDDELPDGETAAELLAHFADLDLSMEWFAYDDVLTTVHFAAEYRGGPLTLGPGGDDGCLFLNSPCNDGVEMEVVLIATTDDGWLSLEVPAVLRGYGTDADLLAENIPIADNAGTLAMQPLQIGGEDLAIDDLHVIIERTDMRKSGVRGMLGATVSAASCGGRCEMDDECGPRQACIGNLCIGGPCNTYEALAEF